MDAGPGALGNIRCIAADEFTGVPEMTNNAEGLPLYDLVNTNETNENTNVSNGTLGRSNSNGILNDNADWYDIDDIDGSVESVKTDTSESLEEGNINFASVDEFDDEAGTDETVYKGCRHYKRKCKIVAPCCGEIFQCRHCHDEAKNDLMSDELELKFKHTINRHAIAEVICTLCDTRQCPSNTCINQTCNQTFAEYYCEKCRFWDDLGIKKKAFHCDECGICRVGGRENNFHCEICSACYALSLKNSHRCIESAMKNDCPICLEDMFASCQPSTVLRCGHTIHSSCFKLYCAAEKWIFRCPTCLKSIQGIDDRMTAHLDVSIAAQEMLPENRRDAAIFCNDCEKRSTTEFHFIGLKCPGCGSYNTAELNAM